MQRADGACFLKALRRLSGNPTAQFSRCQLFFPIIKDYLRDRENEVKQRALKYSQGEISERWQREIEQNVSRGNPTEEP